MEALGGRVAWHGLRHAATGAPLAGTGVWRVNGNLAVARALGDAASKPWVNGQPDVRATLLDDGQDEFILVATGQCGSAYY